ncbi:NADP-dependent phosphogluconate dehydrogenase [Shewanella corallii]|uniref:6-phosphogluconate dehydrogenase, decarboxylating n=1 Tax=Shewanella corallii TaxID=560080 RepID=A0ABT0NAT0_9GAMM|nr:NADP-dependent phosphogluconate dehydrogenase [Shewanella corallii]MCL2915528.1 NADP-dependent phosphogluconate dehydrogenase [Shewanella corallii]
MQHESTSVAAIGVIGLGVMGKNLALNIADNGYRVSAFDLDVSKIRTAEQQALHEFGTQDRLTGFDSLPSLLASLATPRLIVLSIPAGKPVDAVCQSLIEAGIETSDIVVDTGNSLWTDTIEREQRYREHFHFFSSAVSGGEMGARFGPCLMPSGNADAWQHLAPVWEAIAAKVDSQTGLPLERTAPGQTDIQGEPCTAYIGPAGSGHYVKMVHNGIEYADMQLICEAYHLMSSGLGMSAADIGEVFGRWNQGPLNSYLMEISADILAQDDPDTGAPLVEVILDKAGQKGTGLWTAVSSLQLGCPAPTIAEAVYARAVSNQKSLREALSQQLAAPANPPQLDKENFINALESALLCAKVACYAQGFQLMAMNAADQGWQLNFADIARIWRAGCIIRAGFLQQITSAYEAEPNLEHMLKADSFAGMLAEHQQGWREVVAQGVMLGIPVPCISSALSYYDSYRAAVLPANLLQGQRDYFGAHTFERTDKPAGDKYHLNWSQSPRDLVKIG